MQNVVTRVVVSAVNDALAMQGVSVKLQADDHPDNVEHFQPGGLSHRATAGAEGLFLAPGGKSSGGVVIVVSKRSARMKPSKAGGTVLYAEVGSGGDAEIKPDGTGAALIGDNPQEAMVKGNSSADAIDALVVLTAMGPASISPTSAAAYRAALSTKHKLDV